MTLLIVMLYGINDYRDFHASLTLENVEKLIANENLTVAQAIHDTDSAQWLKKARDNIHDKLMKIEHGSDTALYRITNSSRPEVYIQITDINNRLLRVAPVDFPKAIANEFALQEKIPPTKGRAKWLAEDGPIWVDMPVTDKKGKVTYRPLTAAEKKQINDLAMQAMGFNKERGDELTVVNSSFAGEPVEIVPEVPMWKSPTTIEYAKDALRFIVGIVVLFMVYSRVLKPMMTKLMTATPKLLNAPAAEDAIVNLSGEQARLAAEDAYGRVNERTRIRPR